MVIASAYLVTVAEHGSTRSQVHTWRRSGVAVVIMPFGIGFISVLTATVAGHVVAGTSTERRMSAITRELSRHQPAWRSGGRRDGRLSSISVPFAGVAALIVVATPPGYERTHGSNLGSRERNAERSA